MSKDHQWLNFWTRKLRMKSVLELGCGSGIDTTILYRLADTLVACDIEPHTEKIGPQPITRLDHSKYLPFDSQKFDVVVASLCLHYFDWKTTKSIVENLSRVLKKKGLLICRLNSENDINFGSKGYAEIEPGLFSVKGQQKRFFSKADVEKLFLGSWTVIKLKESTIDRYEKEKTVWEFAAINA